jgi:hypothetical protein
MATREYDNEGAVSGVSASYGGILVIIKCNCGGEVVWRNDSCRSVIPTLHYTVENDCSPGYKIWQNYSTRYSRVVPHHSTDPSHHQLNFADRTGCGVFWCVWP